MDDDFFTCTSCGAVFDPDSPNTWAMTDYKFERTGYDGVRDWCTETLTFECKRCGHVAEYASSWVAYEDNGDE